MSQEKRSPTKQFVDADDVHHSGESTSDGEEKLLSQLLNRWMISSEIDRKINAMVAPLSAQLEVLIWASERWRSSGQFSDTHFKYQVNFKIIFEACRTPDTKAFLNKLNIATFFDK